MKKCNTCGRELPKNQFSKEPRNRDGLRRRCKHCDSEYWKDYKYDCDGLTKKHINDIVGGWKCYVVNYAKRGEFKYNIVTTSGDVFKSNDKYEFNQKVKELLCLK